MKLIKKLKLVLAMVCVASITLSSCSNEEFSTEEALTQDDTVKGPNPLANFKTKDSWADSFSVNGKCYCRSTYDHGIGKVKVNGKTVRSICEAMKKEMQKAWKGPGKKVLYNTVQCGHQPAHKDKTIKVNGKKHADEVLCPGEVRNGLKCNSRKGPKWDSKGDDNGDNKSPKVSFATPANNASLKVGYKELYVKVNASDSDGNIAEVSLYIDDKLIRTERKDPFEWGQGKTKKETLGLNVGTHTLKAVAKDNDGASTTVTRTIKVTKGDGNNNNDPSVSFASPSGNVSLKVGYDRLYIKADASDSDGSISEVKLFIDDKFIRVERVDPYEWGQRKTKKETLGLSVGSHILRLEAKDNDGNTTSVTKAIKVTK